MKKILIIIGFIALLISTFYFGLQLGRRSDSEEILSNIPNLPRPTPLAIYTIDALSENNNFGGKLEISDQLADEEKFTSYLFKFQFKPNPESDEEKMTTGQINIPKGAVKFPMILMIRGYIDQSIYKTGDGTKRAAEVFAQNGYITIAPDFLGYAGSSEESGNIFETRFQTYTTILSILSSIEQVEGWDNKNIFIWAHSNGGQIALTTLEISGRSIPTTLWAPVSKPFPYSVLYFTDDSQDHGKLIRSELAKFEEDYDVEKYSLTNYFDRINSPLQIHQGTGDKSVPLEWSNNLVKTLKNKEKDVIYFTYTGADHNLQPNWNQVVARDLLFFRKHLK